MANKASTSADTIIGGGASKILYTLSTVRRIGLLNSAKALTSHNTCKACALGMGGQHGGMTNELDEFPAVCNKSVQAQSTDIQPPIPEEVFQYTLNEFKELSGRDMERLGRLNTPLYKSADSQTFSPVTWEWALDYASAHFTATPAERSFFYSSGRSSNEAGFVLQLLARLYGTNNVTNCSFYCHQATGVGMQTTVGTGTATVELEDLTGCDLIFVIGANPSSNHPRFIHKLKDCRDRGGDVVIINPAKEPGLVRFALPKSPSSLVSGGSWIASDYLQPHIGTDLAVFTGIGKALLAQQGINQPFIDQYTEGFEAYRQQLENSEWEELCQTTGLQQEDFERIAQRYAKADNAVFAWGMGVTHHRHGVENVEAIANLAMLRGMVGKRFAGLLPLRGHSNVQGIGTIGVKPVLAEDVFTNIEQAFGVELPTQKGLDTLAGLTAAHEGSMDAALVMGGNLFEATPDSTWADTALDRIGFKLFLTTTLNRGHVRGMDNSDVIILPVTARDEEPQPTSQESMFNYVRLSDGGIKRLTNVRSETHILCDLAERLIPDCPLDFSEFRASHQVRNAIARVVPGMEELADLDVAKREFHINKRLLHTPDFNTPSRKGQFQTHDWKASDEWIRQHTDYPYRLMSVRSEGQFNSIIYEESDSYRGTVSRDVVLVGSEDLTRLSLKAGDKVDIVSKHGTMNALTVCPFDLPAGNLMAYYPEANVLIGRETDPRSQTPAFKSVAVQLLPATLPDT